MRPKFELLDRTLLERIEVEAFQLLTTPGVRIAPCAYELLSEAGATVKDGVARIPEDLARKCLASAPREFHLYSRDGQPAVHYGGDDVHFDPGSSCLNILDSVTGEARPALASDLVRLVQVTEMLPEYAAQSTAVICNDVPQDAGDWYRLLLVLWHSAKPVVTGAFSAAGLKTMLSLLLIDAGSEEALRKAPRTVFDVCPSPPLNWSEFASQNLLDLARAGVPAEIISMPMAGATAPVTLAGSVVQHTAECISGIVIHQLENPGAPVVWGGAPSIFDMSTGMTPMGSIETAMLDVACSQVGKHFGLPTHGYLGSSDGKFFDAQAGMESGIAIALGALAGINMISGAGMLDFLACHSLEKLVFDAEAIASLKRLIQGIEPHGDSLATAMFALTGLSGNFLKLRETRALLRAEQHFPSAVIDRGGLGSGDNIAARLRQRTDELMAAYRHPAMGSDRQEALLAFARRQGEKMGLAGLPGIPHEEVAAHL